MAAERLRAAEIAARYGVSGFNGAGVYRDLDVIGPNNRFILFVNEEKRWSFRGEEGPTYTQLNLLTLEFQEGGRLVGVGDLRKQVARIDQTITDALLDTSVVGYSRTLSPNFIVNDVIPELFKDPQLNKDVREQLEQITCFIEENPELNVKMTAGIPERKAALDTIKSYLSVENVGNLFRFTAR